MIFEKILEIFLKKSSSSKEFLFIPRHLTQHYQNELSDLYIDDIYVATDYRNIQNELLQYKYQSRRIFTQLFLPYYTKLLEHYSLLGEYVIVPVPMHWTRYILRGFDHTHVLAYNISKIHHLPLQSILTAGWTKKQSVLSRKKRLENKSNTFKIKDRIVVPKQVLLLDDVISTGATANECAKALKNAGVQRVIGIFLASNQ